MNQIDLNAPPPNHVLNVSIEPPESEGERKLRLAKEAILFLVAIGFVIVLFVYCFRTVVSPIATAEEKKWAMSLLSGATGGLIGYLIRK